MPLIQELKVGDVIMPPTREVQLWMRRHCRDKGLSDAALHLTITSIDEASPDKRGRWMLITTEQNDEWRQGKPQRFPFRFKARPETPWQQVR
jgi:hypothetical protein